MPYVRNAGVRIRYEVEGDGPPLVLHTGFSSRLEAWHRNGAVERLADRYRLILIDPRGHGASDKPHDPAAYALAVVVADVVAVLDAVGVGQAHFWGYSRGGWVGFGLGASAADRCHTLIIGGAQPYGSPPSAAALAVTLRERGMEAWAADWERAYGPLSAVDRAWLLANDAHALAAARDAAVATPSLTEELARMELPTLLYCGDGDPVHDQARQAAEMMPNATFVSLTGLDHLQAGRRSDVVVPHVRAFLEQVVMMSQAPALAGNGAGSQP